MAELVRRGITHVVAPAGRDLTSIALEKIYEDGSYRLYRLHKGKVKPRPKPKEGQDGKMDGAFEPED